MTDRAERLQAVDAHREAGVRRNFHRHGFLLPLVVIQQLNIRGVAVGDPEDDAPVGFDAHRPLTLPVALERMQPEARRPDVVDDLRIIELGENRADFVEQVWPDSACVAAFVEAFKASMSEAAYHTEL